jgi:hypothetical protein
MVPCRWPWPRRGFADEVDFKERTNHPTNVVRHGKAVASRMALGIPQRRTL